MKIILDILKAAGIDASKQFHFKVKNGEYMPLSIEGIGTGPAGLPAISVCHYGEQNGDLMRDPEMCFELAKDYLKSAEGTPVLLPYYWRNDYAGIEQESRYTNDGKNYQRPTWLKQHKAFARVWNKNIREQGFLKAVKAGTCSKG